MLRLLLWLLLGLLELSLWPLVLVVLVAVGMFIALFAFDRMFAHELDRADRVEPDAPPASPNVLDLAEWKARRATT